MQPRGSIFQYEFLGGDQLNPSKSGGLFKKTPKNWTFHNTWGTIQEWAALMRHSPPALVFP